MLKSTQTAIPRKPAKPRWPRCWIPIVTRPMTVAPTPGASKEEFEKAIADCGQAIRLNPSCSSAYLASWITFKPSQNSYQPYTYRS